MKKILLVLLSPFAVMAQNFDAIKTVSRYNCDLNFYNSNGVKIRSLNLNEVSFWFDGSGNCQIKDNKQQVSLTSAITSPSFSNIASFISLAKDSCTTSGGGTVSIPQPLYVVDTSAKQLCFPDPLKVSDSLAHVKIDSLISIYAKSKDTQSVLYTYCYRAITNGANFSVGDVIEQVTILKIGGDYLYNSVYYNSLENKTTGVTIFQKDVDGVITGTIPTTGTEIVPCESYKEPLDARERQFNLLFNNSLPDSRLVQTSTSALNPMRSVLIENLSSKDDDNFMRTFRSAESQEVMFKVRVRVLDEVNGTIDNWYMVGNGARLISYDDAIIEEVEVFIANRHEVDLTNGGGILEASNFGDGVRDLTTNIYGTITFLSK